MTSVTVRPRVLVLARNFPNAAFPTLGLWAERLVRAATPVADCHVVAPVPWAPPLPIERARRFSRIPATEAAHGFPVDHPRILVPPGHRLHAFDARMQYGAVRRRVLAIHAEWPIELIHAHLIYPDGVMAAWLGRELGVPVVTTEHAIWLPWLDSWPGVRKQVLEAVPFIDCVTAVSRAVEASVRAVANARVRCLILPNVVDESVFVPAAVAERRRPDRLLFVGAVRHVKGLDVLVKAVALLAAGRPSLHLDVVGEAFYGQWRRDELAVRALVNELGLSDRITFLGRADEAEVAAAMRTAAMLVVPSRRESFSAVAIEALACGTPVVCTRCGGPEDFLSDATGALVPVDDPAGLAAGIARVLDRPQDFEPAALREIAVSRFGRAEATARLGRLYAQVLAERAASR